MNSTDSEVANLHSRLPRDHTADEDVILDAFVEWVNDRGLQLYPAQEEAILTLLSGSHVVLKTPTGSGKSMVAVALHFKLLAQGKRSVYTSPVKALVSEKFFALCHIFGADNVGLLTGDGAVNANASIICCTSEILANMALRRGDGLDFDGVVMDEFHYYGDRSRGMAWQIPLLILTRPLFLLMSATLGETSEIEADITKRTGRETCVVRSVHRPVPLTFLYVEKTIHEAVDALVANEKAPVYVVHFTQRGAAELAQSLMSSNLCSKEEKRTIATALRDVRFDSPYGKDIQRYLRHGIGVHHAGLLPKYRRLVERLSQQGLLKVICGTDTLGVGINVPIRTVLFTQLCKFDGEKVDILSKRDFKQIAGRAGRAGFDDHGHVVCLAPAHVVENQRLAAKAASGSRNKKKFVRRKPPTRGYKHYNKETFQSLIDKPPENLVSVFDVGHGLILDLLQRPPSEGQSEGFDSVIELIERSHSSERRKDVLKIKAGKLLEDLMEAGVVCGVRDEGGGWGDVWVTDAVQDNFSLFHSLSHFLLHGLSCLDAENPDHTRRMVSVTEAILENPRVVLQAQAHQVRGEMIRAMKADGVEYEERMERVEEVSWPKPMAEWIYAVFNDYQRNHPWVDLEHIRPKSVVGEMVSHFVSFPDYIRDMGLQRSEGVLLRYLTTAYKTLSQTIPVTYRTEELDDVLAYLRSTLERVDSSLLTEWQQIQRRAVITEGVESVPSVDISSDQRAFTARVRTELHMLVRCLAMEDYEEASSVIHTTTPWSPDEFADAIEPFIQAHGSVRFDAAARLAHHTRIDKVGAHQWRVSQNLIDEHDEGTWSINGMVDLRDDTNPSGPLMRLIEISQ